MATDSEVWANRANKTSAPPKGTVLKIKTEAAKRRGKAAYKPK